MADVFFYGKCIRSNGRWNFLWKMYKVKCQVEFLMENVRSQWQMDFLMENVRGQMADGIFNGITNQLEDGICSVKHLPFDLLHFIFFRYICFELETNL